MYGSMLGDILCAWYWRRTNDACLGLMSIGIERNIDSAGLTHRQRDMVAEITFEANL